MIKEARESLGRLGTGVYSEKDINTIESILDRIEDRGETAYSFHSRTPVIHKEDNTVKFIDYASIPYFDSIHNSAVEFKLLNEDLTYHNFISLPELTTDYTISTYVFAILMNAYDYLLMEQLKRIEGGGKE